MWVHFSFAVLCGIDCVVIFLVKYIVFVLLSFVLFAQDKNMCLPEET